MKNLKAQFKLIICFFIFLNISNIILAENSHKYSSAEDISNYFSGVLSAYDKQYKKSYSHLKKLNNLEDSHFIYSKYYQYSLIAVGKYKDAAKYSKKLEDKKLDNFESSLISAVFYLKNKNYKKASLNFKKLKNRNPSGPIQNLLSTSLNVWISLKKNPDLTSGLSSLDIIPKKFINIKNVQKTLVHCYFDSPKTNELFKKLISNPDINYSRYNFFHANYLISKKNEIKAKEIVKSGLNQSPKNLMLNQLKLDLEKRKVSSNQFDCRNVADVIAEILFVVSNILASQNNYVGSNFYLNLAKYLNPNFVSFDALYAENLFYTQEYKKAINNYTKIKYAGAVYNWHASKQIASIFSSQDKKEEAINSLKKSFERIVNPTIYEIFDYAEFLKNNEKYKESIKYYSEVLSVIGIKDVLYAQVIQGRGVAYERTDQWNKAEIDLLKSLEASPNDAYVINYLAYSWIEKEIKVSESLEMLRKANNLKPNDGYIIDSLGWALFKVKNYKEAKQYLQLAITYMASDPVINDHYADSLWMNNETLQARYYWNYVLKLEKTEKKLKKKIKQKLLFGLKS